MQKDAVDHSPPFLEPAAHSPEAAAVGRRAGVRPLPGRLNLFQKAMLDWRDLHPYNAVHAVEILHPLDARQLASAIDETLVRSGLTGLELDRAGGRYAWGGGASSTRLDVVSAGADWQQTFSRLVERQLNAPFARDGRIDPFRFFVVDRGGTFLFGLAYDHFIAGGDSIVVLMNAITDRLAGIAGEPTPLERYPRTHLRLFARNPLRFVRALGRVPAMAASCRRTIRPRYRSIEDGRNAFALCILEPAEFGALRQATKEWGVTLNDALMALLLLAQDAQLPGRDRTRHRHELAVASIMNLRDAHREDVRATFGQFLSSFRVSHPVPPGIALRDLARDLHRATEKVKREKLFLATLSALAFDRIIGRFQNPRQRMSAYAKNYPVGAGVSSLDVNRLWRSADGAGAPLYLRAVPTGPASPIAVAVTTACDRLYAGISYRTSAVDADDIARIEADIRSRVHTLR
jgi:hypothetical protein